MEMNVELECELLKEVVLVYVCVEGVGKMSECVSGGDGRVVKL